MTKSGLRSLAFVVLTSVGLAWIPAARAAPSPVGVQVKLSGGIGLLFDGAGDLQGFRERCQDFAAGWWDAYASSTFAWPERSSLPDFRAEVLLTIGPHFGLGFGAGSGRLSTAGDFSLIFDYYDSRWFAIGIKEEYAFQHRLELTVVPLELAAYGFLPLGRLTLYAFGGPGLYLGTLHHDWETRLLDRHDIYLFEPNGHSAQETQSNETGSEKATASGLGLRGGLGAQVRLSPGVSVGFETAFRWAGLGDWTGTLASVYDSQEREYSDLAGWSILSTVHEVREASGPLWVYAIDDPDGAPGLRILGNADLSKVETRRASFDLNGVNFLFTLTFHF